MKLEHSSFTHITIVTMTNSNDAVKSLLQTLTTNNSFQIFGQYSEIFTP